MSQTQLSNFASLAGLIVVVLGYFGVVIEKDGVTFILAAVWSVGWTIYNYYQRYQKGDITLGGIRK